LAHAERKKRRGKKYPAPLVPTVPTIPSDPDAWQRDPAFGHYFSNGASANATGTVRHRHGHGLYPEDLVALKTNYALQVLHALQYLHQHGIILRELRPETIAFKEYPHHHTVQLCDLSSCKEIPSHGGLVPPEELEIELLSKEDVPANPTTPPRPSLFGGSPMRNMATDRFSAFSEHVRRPTTPRVKRMSGRATRRPSSLSPKRSTPITPQDPPLGRANTAETVSTETEAATTTTTPTTTTTATIATSMTCKEEKAEFLSSTTAQPPSQEEIIQRQESTSPTTTTPTTTKPATSLCKGGQNDDSDGGSEVEIDPNSTRSEISQSEVEPSRSEISDSFAGDFDVSESPSHSNSTDKEEDEEEDVKPSATMSAIAAFKAAAIKAATQADESNCTSPIGDAATATTTAGNNNNDNNEKKEEVETENNAHESLFRARTSVPARRYMAPEIFVGEAGYNTQADIYSWAITFAEIYTETKPYTSRQLTRDWDRIAKGELRPNISKCHFPRTIKAVLEHAWHANPKQRATATQLCKSMTTILHMLEGQGLPWEQRKDHKSSRALDGMMGLPEAAANYKHWQAGHLQGWSNVWDPKSKQEQQAHEDMQAEINGMKEKTFQRRAKDKPIVGISFRHPKLNN